MGVGLLNNIGGRTADANNNPTNFWDRVSEGFREFGRQATDCTAGVLSGLGPVDLPAPYQNDQTRALCKAVGATAGLAGDAMLGATGLAEIGGGAALSATGVGAVAGVPISAVGVAQVTAAAAGTVIHANNLSDAVTQMQNSSNAGSSGAGGSSSSRPVYEGSSKHGTVDRGRASRAPTNGQEALDNSVRVKDTSTRRVGIDPKTKEFVVFDETLNNRFHGHVREWGDLTSEMQNALRGQGWVDVRGRILSK